MSWEQDVLDKWSKQYGISNVIFAGYKPCGNYAGFCHGRKWGTPEIIMNIDVDTHYEKHKITCKGVLWHEFGHAYDYWTTGTMGHDKAWMKIYLKKPHLVLAGFLSPFVRW